MLVKNKKFDKVLKVYLRIYNIFALICINIALHNSFEYNKYISYIILIITFVSSAGIEFIIEKDGKEDNDENKG